MPLTAMRAFEAAARHLNFTLAARELSVTQAAISYQVKMLESHLERQLFVRSGRVLHLTPEGQSLLPVLGRAFDRMVEKMEEIRAGDSVRELAVALTPHFAAKWLTPRLGQFWLQNADIELRLYNRIGSVDFSRENFDLAIKWGNREAWQGLDAELLMETPLTLLCSPSLMKGPHPLQSLADLRHHVLLQMPHIDMWSPWLDASGVKNIDPNQRMFIDDYNVLIHAAINGQGLALGIHNMFDDYITNGQLVAPFKTSRHTDMAYYVIYPAKSLERPEVASFLNWLRAEVDADN